MRWCFCRHGLESVKRACFSVTWLAFCEDIDDAEKALAIRKSSAQAHLSYVETILDKIEVAGPLSNSESENYTASILIYKTDTKSEAESLLYADPYYQAGLYGDVTIKRMLPAAGNWVGGKNW